MIYRIVRPLLFQLPIEVAHQLALSVLHYLPHRCFSSIQPNPVCAMGIDFPHRVGLAAGFDKNAQYLQALSKLGFAFIEIGTLTPRPQTGNPKPRLFRLPSARALINRMGFNNDGVEVVLQRVLAADYNGILGINIGKQKETSLNEAASDYVYCLQKVYPHASYITINISSPNTPDLRTLQQGDYFKQLLNQLREEQLYLADHFKRYVPLVIKISPDESDETLKQMAEVILTLGIDGIIATNTTCSRVGVEGLPFSNEPGGLSGAPLAQQSTHCLRILKTIVGDDVTLIGVGGIDQTAVMNDKLKAGATLVQVYSGLIYEGPGLIQQLADSALIKNDLSE